MNKLQETEKPNKEIRELLEKKGIKQYALAKMIGISEFTLSRKMREELPEDQKKIIIDLVNVHCNN